MFPVARGANGQPPRPPTEASRTRRAGLERSRARSRSRCCACCGSGRRRCRRARPPAAVSAATCLGVATPIVSASTTSSARVTRSASPSTTPGSTGPSNGQPNATLIVTVAGRSAAARIRSTRATASLDRRVRVPLVERLGRGERAVDAVERGRAQALVALLVEHEPGVLDAVAALDRGDDLLRAGHLRHAVVADEAGGLDPRHRPRRAGSTSSGARRGREHVGLVLEPVARPDVAEDHESRPYAMTRSGVSRDDHALLAGCRRSRGPGTCGRACGCAPQRRRASARRVPLTVTHRYRSSPSEDEDRHARVALEVPRTSCGSR